MHEHLICIGHRGAAGHEPENTLRSVAKALELGAHGVEIDVQLVGGELVVFHDAKLDRTTNGHGPLGRQTFEELRKLDAGKGEKIPVLREVYDLVRGRAFLNIELKGRGTGLATGRLLRRWVDEEGCAPADFLLSSFFPRELRAFRQVAGTDIPIALLLARPTRFFRRTGRALGVFAVNPNVRYLTRKLVEWAHAEGWKVFPYTVNTPAQLAQVQLTGADGAFTDFPESILGQK